MRKGELSEPGRILIQHLCGRQDIFCLSFFGSFSAKDTFFDLIRRAVCSEDKTQVVLEMLYLTELNPGITNFIVDYVEYLRSINATPLRLVVKTSHEGAIRQALGEGTKAVIFCTTIMTAVKTFGGEEAGAGEN